MRPLEIIILLLIAGSTWTLIRGKIESRNFMQFLFLIVLLTLLHITWEGYRWQMIPAYFLLGLLFIRAKARNIISMGLIGKAVIFLWLIVALALPVLIPVPVLPEPGGPYKIGTKIYQWTDSSRVEWFTDEDPNDLRKLMVQIWYPSNPEKGHVTPAYMDHMDLRRDPLAGAGGFPGFLIDHLGLTKSNSKLDASVDFSNAPYPVVILSHGITGMRQLHTVLIEYLVSRGFVVAAPSHSYDCNFTIFPDGSVADYRSDLTGHPDSTRVRRKQLNTRAADVRFILDRLEKMNRSLGFFHALLDLEKVAVVGHSYGGATAIQASFMDSRFKVCVALDSWMNPVPDEIIAGGINQPFLHLSRPRWDDYPNSPTRLDSFFTSGGSDKYSYIIKGTEHMDFTDIPILTPLSSLVLDTGSIQPKRITTLVNEFVTAFLDEYLIGSEKQFESAVANYPEAILK